MIPQIIYLALLFMSLGISLSKHGEEKTGKYNAWYAFIQLVIILTLLYFGGYFDVLLK